MKHEEIIEVLDKLIPGESIVEIKYRTTGYSLKTIFKKGGKVPGTIHTYRVFGKRNPKTIVIEGLKILVADIIHISVISVEPMHIAHMLRKSLYRKNQLPFVPD